MASLIPLNTFKTITYNINTSQSLVYTTPGGVTTVVLLAQVSNLTNSNTIYVSAIHQRGSNNTYIIKDTPVPSKDATSLLTGKLVLQTGDSFLIYGNANNTGQLLLSFLETANM